MNRGKLIRFGLALLMTFGFFALAACGGGGGGGGEAAPAPAPSPPLPASELQGEYFLASYGEETDTLEDNIPTATITIDGGMGDWAGITPFIADATDDNYSAAPMGTDIRDVYLARDATYLFTRIDLVDGVPNAAGGVWYRLFLLTSGYSSTVQTETWNYPYYIVSAYYDTGTSAWRVQVLRMTSDTTWVTVSTTNAVGIGPSGLEMRIPLPDLGNPTRAFVEARTRTGTGTAAVYHDRTDTLDARFQDIANARVRSALLGTISFDGNGNWSMTTDGADNNEGPFVPSITDSGTYSIAADGTLTVSSASGPQGMRFGLSSDRKMVVGAMVNDPANSQQIGVLLKKGGTHTLTDRNTYGVNFNKDNHRPMCNFAISTQTAAGTLSYTDEMNSPAGPMTGGMDNVPYTRDPDGSGVATYPVTILTVTGPPAESLTLANAQESAIRDDEKFSVSSKLDNRFRNRQRIGFNITRPTAAMSNASLNGRFFVASYNELADRTDSAFGTVTFDGAGTFSASGTYSSSMDGNNQPFNFTGTYTVSAEGRVTMNDSRGVTSTGAVNEEGAILINAKLSSPDRQGISIYVKAQ